MKPTRTVSWYKESFAYKLIKNNILFVMITFHNQGTVYIDLSYYRNNHHGLFRRFIRHKIIPDNEKTATVRFIEACKIMLEYYSRLINAGYESIGNDNERPGFSELSFFREKTQYIPERGTNGRTRNHGSTSESS